jgi:ATP-dependent Clp protease, protease subunit
MKKLVQLLRNNASTTRAPVALVRAEDSADATLYIYDVIDAYWGINAREVAQAIAGLDSASTLHLRINSPGGDVFEARAIAAAIAQHAGKTVAHIDGLAASAATTIAAAADEVEIVEGGFYMIHNAWTFSMGNRHDLRETANLLEKVDGAIVADYATRTGATPEQLAQWMDAETWFTAQEAVDNKFADRIAQPASKGDNKATASAAATPRTFNLDVYDKTPQALLEPAPAPNNITPDSAAVRAANERRLRLLSID